MYKFGDTQLIDVPASKHTTARALERKSADTLQYVVDPFTREYYDLFGERTPTDVIAEQGVESMAERFRAWLRASRSPFWARGDMTPWDQCSNYGCHIPLPVMRAFIRSLGYESGMGAVFISGANGGSVMTHTRLRRLRYRADGTCFTKGWPQIKPSEMMFDCNYDCLLSQHEH